jgi:hypothetical protein
MTADQRNFDYSDYLGDDGVHYCVKADANMIALAATGGAVCTNAISYGTDTRRRHKRFAIYRDGTTFRTVKTPIFTPTAFNALTVGTSTIAVHVPGETAAVTYTLVQLVAEKRPGTVLGRTDPDHA